MSYFGKAISEKDILGLYSAYNDIYDASLDCWTTVGQDTQFLVDVDDTYKLITVAFLGSTSTTDWMNNLEADTEVLRVYNDIEIKGHDGFFDAYTTDKETILAAVNAAVSEHPDYAVYALGHSLGGATAQVFAFEYFVETGTKVHLITYGSPKVWANDETIAAVKETMASICQIGRANDAVVTVPSWYDSHLDCSKIGKFNIFHYLNIKKYHCSYQTAKNYDCSNLDEVFETLKAKM